MLQIKRVYKTQVPINELRGVILADLLPDFDQEWARNSGLTVWINQNTATAEITFTEKETSDAQAQAG